MKTFYRSHEIIINTDAKTNQIVYDVFRNRQYVMAGFSHIMAENEVRVLDRLKDKINDIVSQAYNLPPGSHSEYVPSKFVQQQQSRI